MRVNSVKSGSFKNIANKTSDLLKKSTEILSSVNPINVLWKFKTGGIFGKIFRPQNDVYLRTNSDDLIALKQNGSFKWKKKLSCSYMAQDLNGNILVSTYDKSRGLVCIDTDGKELWNAPFISYPMTEPIVTKDDKILVGSWDGNLYCLDSSGKLEWEFKKKEEMAVESNEIINPPVLDSCGNIYFVNGKNQLFALDSGGKERWEHSLGAQAWGGDARDLFMLDDNTMVYLRCGNMKAFDSLGRIKWSQNVFGFYSKAQMDSSKNIYIISQESILYSFSPTGDLRWKYKIDSAMPSSEFTIDSGGNIYITDSTGNLFAVDKNGGEKWRFKGERDEKISNPSTSKDEKNLYLTGSRGNFYILDSASGDLKSKYKAPIGEKEYYYAPFVLDDDEAVLLRGSDGFLYAASTKSQKELIKNKIASNSSCSALHIENMQDSIKIGNTTIMKNKRWQNV